MISYRTLWHFSLWMILFAGCGLIPLSWAQTPSIPGSAEPGRLDADPEKLLAPQKAPDIRLPDGSVVTPRIPSEAEAITFKFKGATVDGNTALSDDELADIFAPHMGEEIKLSKVWEFAGRITERYRAKGFFLSRAYVPAQNVEDGTVMVSVLEGYISAVRVQGTDGQNPVFKALIKNISNEKPANIKSLERNLLLLNDIPGLRFEAILSSGDELEEGAVELILNQQKSQSRGSIGLDNHGSRFTGPLQVSGAYATSFLPNHETTLGGIVSVADVEELRAFSLNHKARILPTASALFSVSRTDAEPGFTLEPFDVESESFSWRVGLKKQFIRQRHTNLSADVLFDYRDSDTDILGAATTRDRIRTLRFRLNYDTRDVFNGQNNARLTLSQGLDGFGASDKGDANLSRAGANPDYTTLYLNWERQQPVAPDWLLRTTAQGQKSSGDLYASEEFGFGGPRLGRAFDSSELIGDDGIAIGLEMRFTGMAPIHNGDLTPFVFYDFGRVWNDNPGQPGGLSASSAGVGVNYLHRSGVTADLTIAQPIVKSVDTPPFGGDGNIPRAFFQLGYTF